MGMNDYGNYVPRFSGNYYSPPLPNQRAIVQQQYEPVPQQPQTNISWLSGGEAALGAIQTPPNSMYCFFSNDDMKFYFKTVDGNGRPTIKTFEYHEYIPNASQNEISTIDTENFVTKEEFQELNTQLNSLKKALNDFKSKIGNANKKENGGVKPNGKSVL